MSTGSGSGSGNGHDNDVERKTGPPSGKKRRVVDRGTKTAAHLLFPLSMTVPALKYELRARKLRLTGNRTVLMKRLSEHLVTEQKEEAAQGSLPLLVSESDVNAKTCLVRIPTKLLSCVINFLELKEQGRVAVTAKALTRLCSLKLQDAPSPCFRHRSHIALPLGMHIPTVVSVLQRCAAPRFVRLCSITDKSMQALCDHNGHSLTSTSLFFTARYKRTLACALVPYLAKCPRLQTLNVTWLGAAESASDYLFDPVDLPSITELKFLASKFRWQPTDSIVNLLQYMPNLKRLSLWRCTLRTGAIQLLGKACPNLQTLDLDDIACGDEEGDITIDGDSLTKLTTLIVKRRKCPVLWKDNRMPPALTHLTCLTDHIWTGSILTKPPPTLVQWNCENSLLYNFPVSSCVDMYPKLEILSLHNVCVNSDVLTSQLWRALEGSLILGGPVMAPQLRSIVFWQHLFETMDVLEKWAKQVERLSLCRSQRVVITWLKPCALDGQDGRRKCPLCEGAAREGAAPPSNPAHEGAAPPSNPAGLQTV